MWGQDWLAARDCSLGARDLCSTMRERENVRFNRARSRSASGS